MLYKLYFKINHLIGGGVPGLSLAQAVLKNEEKFSSSRKLNITLIDNPNNLTKENFTYKDKRIPDPRVISLTPASIRFLESIGLWERLDKRLINFVRGIQINESKGSSFVSLDVNDIKTIKNNTILNLFKSNNLLGKNDYVNLDFIDKVPDDFVFAFIEINHMVFHLQEMLKNKINIVNKSIQMDKIDIDNNDDYCYLTINNPQENDLNSINNMNSNLNKSQTFRAKLVVASDGGNSVIRNKLKMQTTGYQYNETGLVCTLRGNKSSDVAFQRFLHNGIFALLPLYDDLYSIVCSMPKNINEDLKNLDNEKFLEFVNGVLHNPSEMDTSQLDRLLSKNYVQPPVIEEIVSKKFELNLQLQYANNPVNKNVVLIGDASHMIHPMAGQGLNLGIMDSAFLADEITKALNSGRRINDLRALKEFNYRSQLNTRLMVATLETIKIIYGPTNSIFSAVRNFGMSVSNSSEILRGLFILSASGIASQPNKFAWESN